MDTLYENQNIFWSYIAHFFLEWEMFEKKCLEKIETHFMFSNFYCKIVTLMR